MSFLAIRKNIYSFFKQTFKLVETGSPPIPGVSNHITFTLHHESHVHKGTFFFFLFRAVPTAHGSSQVRSLTRARLPAYATATATPDPSRSHICNLHHSSEQCRILNPLSRARDQTCILMDISQVPYC